MYLTWILFVLLAAAGYVFLTIVSSSVGFQSQSLVQSLGRLFSPAIFSYMLVGNILLAAAVYYGFLATPYAVTILIAIGVVTSVLYTVLFLDGVVSVATTIGLLFILLGIYIMK